MREAGRKACWEAGWGVGREAEREVGGRRKVGREAGWGVSWRQRRISNDSRSVKNFILLITKQSE